MLTVSIPVVFFSNGLYSSNFLILCNPPFPGGCLDPFSQYGNVFIPTWERGHLGCSIHKNSALKLSKYEADTFDMILNALEDNKMAEATVYNCVLKGKKA